MKSDALTARMIIDQDKAINSFEIDIDNSTFNTLALSEGGIPPELLRQILAIQKINPVLERIGDHAVNIAEAQIILARNPHQFDIGPIGEMGKECFINLSDASGSFFDGNMELATDVLGRDGTIDDRYTAITSRIKNHILAGAPELPFDAGLTLIRICQELERISDLSMNIAEEAMYAIDGCIVKHQMLDG
jgi:phosphate transport system protein